MCRKAPENRGIFLHHLLSGGLVLGNPAVCGHANDLAALILTKPKSTIGTGGDSIGDAFRGWNRIFGNLPTGRDATDLVSEFFAKPDCAVGTCRYSPRYALRGRYRILRDSIRYAVTGKVKSKASYENQGCKKQGKDSSA